MDASEFRKVGKEMIDYVADYLETISERPPFAQVQPGYLKDLIPDEAPVNPEPWKDVFSDIERVIMPGVTHWQSPHFHAYYPSGCSYPSILADILSDAIGSSGFTWASGPVNTELEVITLNWLGKMIKLPEIFLTGGEGGAVIQSTASESTFFAFTTARNRKVKSLRAKNPEISDEQLLPKFVMYYSDQAHSSVERAGLLGGVLCHKVTSDDKESMRGEALRQAIEEDKRKGLVPFFCVATSGSTPTCAFDNLVEIGPICEENEVWLHIDAAYAGGAFICEEFRYLLNGVEHACSFNFNPHKLLMVHLDLSALWFRHKEDVDKSFRVDPVYLKHGGDSVMPDYRHWSIPFGRRFRSLKLWFVLRSYGITGLQNHIRKQVSLAMEFKELVKQNSHFELTHDVILGLVCFRLKGDNELTKSLHRKIISDNRIHLVLSESKGIFFIRFVICSASTNSTDVVFAWKVIEELSEDIIDKK